MSWVWHGVWRWREMKKRGWDLWIGIVASKMIDMRDAIIPSTQRLVANFSVNSVQSPFTNIMMQ
jgi:hypothetical protein